MSKPYNINFLSSIAHSCLCANVVALESRITIGCYFDFCNCYLWMFMNIYEFIFSPFYRRRIRKVINSDLARELW